MSDIVFGGNYSISYNKGRNQIVIGLPQTAQTATNTIEPVTNRRTEMTFEEQALLLSIVRYIFEGDVHKPGTTERTGRE